MAILVTGAIAILAALGAALLHHLVQRRFGYDILARHNEVAGFVYSAIGVIFAVVLGFVVIVVWQKYDEVRGYVDAEVAAVIDLYHTVDGFDPQMRDRIRTELVAYAHAVQYQEWPAMARGEAGDEGTPQIEAVAHQVQTYAPVGATQQDAHQLALTEVKEIFDSRRQRIRSNEPSVPPILWFALYAGAAAALGFIFLFGVENRVAQLLMTGTLAGLIAIMFVVIAGLDSPFRGASAIPPSGWAYFQNHIKVIVP